jgi:hypothetical protein
LRAFFTARFLAREGLLLPLHGRLLVVLALADLGEDTRLLSGLLEALEGALDGLTVLHSNTGHAVTSFRVRQGW